LIIYLGFVFFAPDFFGEEINYVEANPLQTPPHIVPEWYFLPYYAILRSINFDIWFIPAKLIGVCLMFGSILILFLLPWLDTSKVRSARFRPIYKQFFWLLLIDGIVLGYVGAHPPEGFMIVLGQVATAYYFLHFLVVMPLIGKLETPRPLPVSISEPVLK
jgi:quinol-cytochrome oxidoreductase complex cytochrome b subunit